MLYRLLLLLVPILLASALAGQPPYPVGTRDVSLPGGPGQSSAILTARIHYPAATAGANAALLARPGGWPVVVYLHGFAVLGNFYGALGDGLAAAGFIAVMSNTAQFDNNLQELDGRALFAALEAAGRASGGPFEGALDMSRAGLLGHSMGGGNVANVLAANPGYRCGFALAPVTPRAGNAGLVQVPLGIAAGAGDSTTPWQSNAQPYYQGLSAYTGLKLFYLLDGSCNHTNVAGIFLTSSTAREVFGRVLSVALGFFGRFLEGQAAGLESAIGPGALEEPRLLSLSLEIERPEPWPSGRIQVGKPIRLSVAAEPGPAGLLAAFLFASVAGPERRVDWTLALPADPVLIGASMPVQAFGSGRATPLRLGAAARLGVGG